jgi:hypothetical protein
MPEEDELREHPVYKGYFVSRSGKVYSNRQGGLKELKSNLDYKGYPRVDIYCGRGAARLHRMIHRLVLETFVGPRPPGFTCDHKDGIKTNNALDNLEWVTVGENNRRAWAMGLCEATREGARERGGERGPNARLTWAQVREIRDRCSLGETWAALAREFGVSIRAVGDIVHGQTWKEPEATQAPLFTAGDERKG